MIRRSNLLLLLVVLACVVLLLVPPAAAADKTEATLLTPETAAVIVGDTAWLALMWEATGDLRNFEVTVSEDGGAEIGYPLNTRDRAAPYHSVDLLDGEIDYTAIAFRYPEEAKSQKEAKLTVVATWDGEKGLDSDKFKITVPLVVYDGDDLRRVTDTVSVQSGQVEWVEIAYSGLAPHLTGFSLTVDGPDGVGILYPGDGTATSLHSDATLQDGETDVARFRIDASAVEPGLFELGIVASYTRGDQNRQLAETISLEITS